MRRRRRHLQGWARLPFVLRMLKHIFFDNFYRNFKNKIYLNNVENFIVSKLEILPLTGTSDSLFVFYSFNCTVTGPNVFFYKMFFKYSVPRKLNNRKQGRFRLKSL